VIEPRWLLLGLLLPCAIAAGSVWLLMRCREKPTSGGRWVYGVSIIGVTIAIAVGMLSLTGLPPWKPIVNLHWILMAILPAALMVALLGLSGRVPGWLVWTLRLVIACGTAPLLTYTLVPYTWSKPEAAAWWVGLGLWISVFWILMRVLAKRCRGQLVVFVLGGTCGAAGGVTIASGYLTGGQYAASLAFVLLGVWLVMLLCQIYDTVGPAIVDLTIAPLSGWLIYNWQYGWTMQNDASPFVVAGLLAVAPLGAWACRLPLLKGKSQRQQAAAAVLACGFLLALAVGLAGYEAMQRVQETSTPYGY
jgi:hypothetical protein